MADETKQNPFPEAGAVVFFGYRRLDGFEVSLTLKDNDGQDVLKRLEGAIAKLKSEGSTPLPLKGGFGQKQAKPVNYVDGRKCPKCGNRLVKAETKDGRKFIKCETNKYDFQLKKAIGCPFTEWEQQKQIHPPEDIPVRQYADSEDDYIGPH